MQRPQSILNCPHLISAEDVAALQAQSFEELVKRMVKGKREKQPKSSRSVLLALLERCEGPSISQFLSMSASWAQGTLSSSRSPSAVLVSPLKEIHLQSVGGANRTRPKKDHGQSKAFQVYNTPTGG